MNIESTRKCVPPALTGEEFRTTILPPKQPLVGDILYRRDLVAFAGRRRNGKTSIFLQLALSLTVWGCSGFLGHDIDEKRRVLLYLLEDDARELQDRLNRMLYEMDGGDEMEGRLLIRTKDDFYANGVPVDVSNKDFCDVITSDCDRHRPDLILFDNLGFLVGADYNDSKTIHRYIEFIVFLSQKYNCAIITAAHPRKQGEAKHAVTLAKDRDMFFEEVMGSSHFVNSCGSLWGIERTKEGYSHFYAGAQRLSGNAQPMAVEMDDDGWFLVADDFEANLKLVLSSKQREDAWNSLPEKFTYTEARAATKQFLKSKNSFTPFWNALKRLKLVTPADKDRNAFTRAQATKTTNVAALQPVTELVI